MNVLARAVWHLRVRLTGDAVSRQVLSSPSNTLGEDSLALWFDRNARPRDVRLLASSPHRWHRKVCATHAATDMIMCDRRVRRHMLADPALKQRMLLRRTSGTVTRIRMGGIDRHIATLVRTTPSLTHEDLCRIGDMTRRGETAMAVSEHPSFSPALLRELLVDFDGYVDALVRQPAVLFRSDMRQVVCELAAPDSAALTRIIEMAMSTREVRTAFRRQATGAPDQVAKTISKHGDVLLASLLREDLLPLLDSDDENVRAWAITALGVVGRRGCVQEETRANVRTFLGLRRTRRLGLLRIDPIGISLAGWRLVPERIVRALALDDSTRYGEYPHIPLGSRWALFAPAKSERGRQFAGWLARRRLLRSLEVFAARVGAGAGR